MNTSNDRVTNVLYNINNCGNKSLHSAKKKDRNLQNKCKLRTLSNDTHTCSILYIYCMICGYV